MALSVLVIIEDKQEVLGIFFGGACQGIVREPVDPRGVNSQVLDNQP